MPGPTDLTAPVVDALHVAANHPDPLTHLAALLARPTVLVTGARAATAYGEHVASELGAALAARGITLLTGAAYGIDAAVARGALANDGRVVVALPGGIDRMHPAGNAHLIERVRETGVVLSTYPDGVAANRTRFVERSNLLAQMAGAMIVVESGLRSTALASAQAAHDTGRPVFAVPGPVTSAVSAGCHDLIKAGTARLLTNVEDLDGLTLTGVMPIVAT